MYGVTLKLPGNPNRYVLAESLNVLAVANAIWFLEQFAEGLEPPCCAKCAHIKWDPDVVTAEFASAPDMLRKGRASCGPIAAYDAGAEMAKLARQTGDFEAAKTQYGVDLLVEDEPYSVAGPDSVLETRQILSPGQRSAGRVHFDEIRRENLDKRTRRRRMPTYHAVVLTPNGIKDPTAKMERLR